MFPARARCSSILREVSTASYRWRGTPVSQDGSTPGFPDPEQIAKAAGACRGVWAQNIGPSGTTHAQLAGAAPYFVGFAGGGPSPLSVLPSSIFPAFMSAPSGHVCRRGHYRESFCVCSFRANGSMTEADMLKRAYRWTLRPRFGAFTQSC